MYYYVDYKVIDLIKVYETINGVLHKRCSMCKAVKPVSEYSPAGDKFQAACKVCRAAYEVKRTQGEDERRKKREREQKRRDSEEGKKKIKEYNSRPEIIKRSREYAKVHNKEYYSKPENREKIRQYNKKYSNDPINKEKQKQYNKEYKESHTEALKVYKSTDKFKLHAKAWAKDYHGKADVKERTRCRDRKKYSSDLAYKESKINRSLARYHNPAVHNTILEQRKNRRKDPAQKESVQAVDAKHAFKRRGLGFKPINKNFSGAVKHHLRYTNDPKYKDNDIVIHIPKELHVSIPHNGNTGKGMAEINTRALEWYFNNTPAESRDKQAIKLYWTYLTHPAPVWRTKKEKSQD